MNLMNIDFKQPNNLMSNVFNSSNNDGEKHKSSQPLFSQNLIDKFERVPSNIVNEIKNETTYMKNDIVGMLAPVSAEGYKEPNDPINSRLVNDSILKTPENFVIDIKENLVNIKKALKGESCDHDLGRINDFAIKAGALGLAGYLFTRAKTPTTKAMEFVGFGSFFASMALWPKLFIELPVKLMHGHDINQKYIDNNGRKKRFSLDPQYKPWNLYTEEQISELGDRMGVPKNIHNRNEVIKTKADKLELQSNTLWMLTAGFATPLMSALICNGLEKHVTNNLEKARVAMALANAKKAIASDNVVELDDNTFEIKEKYSREIDDILGDSNKTVLTEKELNRLVSVMTHNNDIFGEEALRSQLKELMPKIEDVVDKSFVDYFYNVVNQHNKLALKDTSLKTFDLLPENKADIEALFKSEMNTQNFAYRLIKHIEEAEGVDLKQSKQKAIMKFVDLAKILYDKQDANIKIETIEDVKDALRKSDAFKVTAEAVEKIKKLDKIMIAFSKELNSINAYNEILLNKEAETVLTNRWLKTTREFFDLLNLDEKELIQAKNEGNMVSQIVKDKLSNLAADKKKYEAAFETIRDSILELDKMFLPDAEGNSQGRIDELKKYYSDMFAKYYKVFDAEKDFDIVAYRIFGDADFTNSIKSNVYRSMDALMYPMRSNMYKLLHALDLFRRIETGEMEEVFNQEVKGKKNIEIDKKIIQKFPGITESEVPLLSSKEKQKEALASLLKQPGVSAEAVEIAQKTNKNITEVVSTVDGVAVKETTIHKYAYCDFVSKVKSIMMNATIADFTTKFKMLNPARDHYNAIMKMLYSSKLSAVSEDLISDIELGDTNFATSFKNYIDNALAELGAYVHPHNSAVVVDIEKEKFPVNSNYFTRDVACGPQISNVVRDKASQLYNSNKWLGRYGGMFLGLVGVTLFAETFFGKINKKDMNVKKG